MYFYIGIKYEPVVISDSSGSVVYGNLTIYPNPFISKVVVEGFELKRIGKLVPYDIIGR